jgi:hypothetical protein
MGLILAMLVVVCPDIESHTDVISVTSRGAIRNGPLKRDWQPNLRCETKPVPKKRGFEAPTHGISRCKFLKRLTVSWLESPGGTIGKQSDRVCSKLHTP